MKNEAEMVAGTHVADGHEVGIDHPEPFVERGRLAGLAQAAQSIQSICTAAAVSTWTAAVEPSVQSKEAKNVESGDKNYIVADGVTRR